jgi:site-specific recombinase XerC
MDGLPEGGVPAEEVAALPAAVQAYLEHVRVQKRLADRTCTLYALDLARLCAMARDAGQELLALQPAHVRRFVAQMHSRGRSPRGIALILSGWRSFFRWAAQQSLVPFNPVEGVRGPKAPKPLPKALGVDDAVQLAAFSDAAADPWIEARDAAITELLYSCGLRVGELVGLDVAPGKDTQRQGRGWIDLQAADAHVQGKGGKRRTVPVGTAALQALQRWLALRQAGLAGAASGWARSRSGRGCASAASRRACRPASIPMCCGIRSPATCSNRAATCAPCRSCWAMPAFPPRRSIRGWISSTWPRPTRARIRGRCARLAVAAKAATPNRGRSSPLAKRHLTGSLNLSGTSFWQGPSMVDGPCRFPS